MNSVNVETSSSLCLKYHLSDRMRPFVSGRFEVASLEDLFLKTESVADYG